MPKEKKLRKAIKKYIKETGKNIAAPKMKGSPYMMYGKKSSKLEGGSPLAKYGCSKKYKK